MKGQPIPVSLQSMVSDSPIKGIGPMRPFICTIPVMYGPGHQAVMPIVLLGTDPAQIARDHGATVFVS